MFSQVYSPSIGVMNVRVRMVHSPVQRWTNFNVSTAGGRALSPDRGTAEATFLIEHWSSPPSGR